MLGFVTFVLFHSTVYAQPYSVPVVTDVAEQKEIATEVLPTEEVVPPTLIIIKRPISSGYRHQSARNIDTVVLHSAFAKGEPNPYDPEAVIRLFRQYSVSAHYVIARDGVVYQLVEEHSVSFHAGRSLMSDGRRSVNRFSIGIEIINNFEDSPTEAQYTSLGLLLEDIRTRHDITHVVAHKEVAPHRRSDPWNFDWERIKKE